MHLRDLVQQLAEERAIAPCTAAGYRYAVDSYSAHLGRPAAVADLDRPAVNRWLVDLESQLQPVTVRNYRRGLLVVWNYAARLELAGDYDHRRIRLVKLPQREPIHVTPADVAELLGAAERLPGRLRCGLAAGPMLRAYIRIGFETGLRPGDVRRLCFSQIDDSGIVRVVQHKTGRLHLAQLSPQTLGDVAAIRFPRRSRLFPLGAGGLRRWADRLIRSSRLSGRISLHALRHAHATAIAAQYGLPAAAASLGHVSGLSVARRFYVSPEALRPVLPPPAIPDAV